MNMRQESKEEFLVYAKYIDSKFQVFIDNSGTGFSIVFEADIGRGQTENLYPWQRIRK